MESKISMEKTRQSLLALDESSPINLLENEWAKYKYLILAKDPNAYNAIRKLLKNKGTYPVREFFEIVDAALSKDTKAGYEVNAAQHVFGYFRNKATSEEKYQTIKLIFRLSSDANILPKVKSTLLSLAQKYEEKYLLESYYFNSIL